ncbi:MAG: hypothetical protein FWB76_03465 [Oscillospiraceae bacterium]|nr:hypothetical protein [Oscillospiraceae bacterium]
MKKNTVILGISAYYHDSAAAILRNGEIVAAAQEERFTRKKADASFPHNAIDFCLQQCSVSIEDVDEIVFYEDPLKKFERLLQSQHWAVPKSIVAFLHAMPKWLTQNLWMEKNIARELGLPRRKILFCDHHQSHAASAFYPSPFEQAAILTVDGVGEWSTVAWGVGEGNHTSLQQHMTYPNSLGLLYSAFTYYCGFKINSGEYKLMGLAPYGQPRFADTIKQQLISLHDDGSFTMNQNYFSYTHGMRTINRRFEALFGQAARKPESEITQHYMDVAASIQVVTNEVLLAMAKHVRAQTGQKNLVLAGGVALNVVSMGLLQREAGFEHIWVQPAAGDAGGALGAALWAWHDKHKNERRPTRTDRMQGAFLGIDIPLKSREDDIALNALGGVWENQHENTLARKVAELIAQGKVVGVARGRAEWGPRALGNRSIFANAQDRETQYKLNVKIKAREGFRPFAPMVLREDAAEYFSMQGDSPYMLFTYPVREERRLNPAGDATDIYEKVKQVRSNIPAVTHVDYSARVQTVDASNAFAHTVLQQLKKETGCSVMVNTSFNVRGEPIVNTAQDAYRCFMATDMDYVVIGNRLFDKTKQRRPAK